MPTVAIEHIEVDESGTARVAGTRSRVISIVLDTLNGLTPAQIHEGYPHLSLAQIHAALAYYYDHQTRIDAEIAKELSEVDLLRQESGQPSRDEFVRRLGKPNAAALSALRRLQAKSAAIGKDRMSSSEIDAEIRRAGRTSK